MFDVYEFFNSADIAKYLKDMGWKFTPLEKAWIVYKSTKKPYSDKKNAWCEIIKQSDDFLIKKRNCLLEKDIMFHDALMQYMDYRDSCIEKLKLKEEGWIYYYSLISKIIPGDEFCNGKQYDGGVFFSSFDGCEKYCKEALSLQSYDCDSYEIVKRKLYDVSLDSEDVFVTFDKNSNILDSGIALPDDEPEISDFFESLWFYFPVPFKKGDIVCNCLSNKIFIFDLCNYDKKDSRYAHHLEDYDATGMTFSAYELTKDGRLFWDVNWCYTDLEYYRGDFSGVKNILRIASEYIKGEIPIDLFINAYTDNFLDKIKDYLKNEYSFFLPESLERIGKKREDYVNQADRI